MQKLISVILCVLLLMPGLSQIALASEHNFKNFGDLENDLYGRPWDPPGSKEIVFVLTITVIGSAIYDGVKYVVTTAVSRTFDSYTEAANAKWSLALEAKDEFDRQYRDAVWEGSTADITEETRLTPYGKLQPKPILE